MAIESVMGTVGQNYLTKNQDINQNEATKVVPETTSEVAVEETAINNEVTLLNIDKATFGTEVKELSKQVQEGNVTIEEARKQIETMKESLAPTQIFNYQNTSEFGHISGSLTIAQANMSQTNVTRLLA